METSTQGLYEAVKNCLGSEVQIIHLTLAGSHGKKIGTRDEDYEVKALVVHSFSNRLLNRVEEKKSFETMFQNRVVKGIAFDIKTAFDYALGTNPQLIDLIRGPVIYSENQNTLEKIKEVYERGFNPYLIFKPINGQLYSIVNKELKHALQSEEQDSQNEAKKAEVENHPKSQRKGSKNKETVYKKSAPVSIIVDSLHLGLQLRCLLQGKNISNYYTLDEIIEFAGQDKEEIENLLKIRKENKDAEVEINEKIQKILEESIKESFDKAEQSYDKEGTKFTKEKKEMEQTVNAYILTYLKKLFGISQ